MEQETKINRRRFFKTSTLVALGGAVTFGVVSVPFLKSDQLLLRPPGALDEDVFLASCIKCGQCLQVCPPQVIELVGISAGFAIGTPYIIPREGGCILCAGLPCVLACPTGALDHQLSLGKDAEMGLAVVSGPERCLSGLGINDLVFRLENLKANWQSSAKSKELGKILKKLIARLTLQEKKIWQDKFSLLDLETASISRKSSKLNESDLPWLTEFMKKSAQARQACRICLDECPIKEEKLILFADKNIPGRKQNGILPVVQKTCVGCGVCEEKCPTEPASIITVPRLKWSEQTT